MDAIDAFVNYCHDDVPVALRGVPSLRCADQGHRVERTKRWIVGRQFEVTEVVWLGVQDIIASVERGHRLQRFVWRHAGEPQPFHQIGTLKAIQFDRDLLLTFERCGGQFSATDAHVHPAFDGAPGLKAHQHLAGHKLGTLALRRVNLGCSSDRSRMRMRRPKQSSANQQQQRQKYEQPRPGTGLKI